MTQEQSPSLDVTQPISATKRSHLWRNTFWLLVVAVVLYSWCSLLSGVGGWVLGYDLGKREARAILLPAKGILVIRVERNSPADQAGIRRGDTIIALNGSPVDDVVALRHALLGYAPGESVLVTYRRDLIEQTTQVTLGWFPENVTTSYMGIYYTARAESPADL